MAKQLLSTNKPQGTILSLLQTNESDAVPVLVGSDVLPGGSIFATMAALSASPTGGLSAGVTAVVQSQRALWYLDPASALTIDNSTIIAAQGGGRWLRGPTLDPETWTALTAWSVDPVAGSDDNPGTAPLPLRTKAEIGRRWGTWAPVLAATVTVTQATPDTNGLDPWLAVPNFLNGASLILTTPLPAPSFTGTLLAVTAKNVATGTPLESTFTTVTGAVASRMMLVNATRGNSRAVAHRNAGGGNWILTQPCQPLTPPFGAGFVVEVDTWANGDSITGYMLSDVAIGQWGASSLVVENANDSSGSYLYQLNVRDFDASPGNGVTTAVGLAGAGYYMAECTATTGIYGGGFNQQLFPLPVFANCYFPDGFAVQNVALSAGGCSGFGVYLYNGLINSDFVAGNFIFTEAVGIGGSVYLDASSQWQAGGSGLTFGSSSIVYGPSSGTLNGLAGATVLYASGAGKAAATFKGITLNCAGKTTAYSNANAGGAGGVVTVHGAITLTAAALDTAAGATGFGGYAYGGGATFSSAGAQP